MGLIVNIFKWDLGDCSNNGVSARSQKLTLTNVEGPFEPSDDAPAAKLVKHRTCAGHIYIVPDECGDRWTMFGGCFAYSSDSRFSDAVKKLSGNSGSYAVQIHDRIEV